MQISVYICIHVHLWACMLDVPVCISVYVYESMFVNVFHLCVHEHRGVKVCVIVHVCARVETWVSLISHFLPLIDRGLHLFPEAEIMADS